MNRFRCSGSIKGIDINYFHGAYIAAKYLIEKGHQKIIYFTPQINTVQDEDRLKGVQQAIMDSGSNGDILKLVYGGKTDAEFRENLIKMFKTQDEHTALIVNWYYIAFMALYLANKTGKKIPEDLAVIPLGGSGFANYTYPMLSTSDTLGNDH